MSNNFADSSDGTLIAHALSSWANWIETGDLNISAIDAAQMDRTFNALTLDQMKLVIRLRELSAVMQQA